MEHIQETSHSSSSNTRQTISQDVTRPLPSRSNQEGARKKSVVLQVFETYVDKFMYSLYILVGLGLNGTLLCMFARHKELRTTANVMILNLSICDVLNLSISGPLHFPSFYKTQNDIKVINCRCYLAIRQFFRAADAFSLLGLNIQRFCITVPRFQRYNNSTLCLCTSVLIIYVLALSVALPSVLVWEVYSHLCSSNPDGSQANLMLLLHFVIYCLVLAPLMFLFSCLTAFRLKKSIRLIPGEMQHSIQEQMRNRSAKVLIILSVLFVICYYPYELWNVIVFFTVADKKDDVVALTLIFSKYFLFSNACFNPVALFVVSGKFRKLFKQYWCCFRPVLTRNMSGNSAQVTVSSHLSSK
ncbi:neuropeptide CCHamide-2 receptor-like [Periplaneta americana]|uniref:neuropeptide CCHamide-2 receptor-like n=1 Tax=Periplaneta americana TaxID=6978 RepID=UPI0037E7CA1C